MVSDPLPLLLLVINAGDDVSGPAYLDHGGAHIGLALTAPVIHTQTVTVQRSVIRGGSGIKKVGLMVSLEDFFVTNLLLPLSLAVVTGSDSGWPESCSTESLETLLTNENQYRVWC